MPASTAQMLRTAISDHGAGFVTCFTVPFFLKPLTVIIHSVTLPTRTCSRTRVLVGATASHLPLTVPLISAIKAGQLCESAHRLRLPLLRCARAGRPSPGPGLALVPGHDAPGPAVPHYVRGPDVRPSRPVRRQYSRRRTSESSGSAVAGPPGRCSPAVCNLDCPD